MRRECIRCAEEITACMGCVLARDLVDAFEGKISPSSIRELCAKCAEILSPRLATMSSMDLVQEALNYKAGLITVKCPKCGGDGSFAEDCGCWTGCDRCKGSGEITVPHRA